jgi:hypothetical protein
VASTPPPWSTVSGGTCHPCPASTDIRASTVTSPVRRARSGCSDRFSRPRSNQNTALWRLAPGATTIELQAIDWIRSLVGFPPGSEGIFSSGGQLANTIAHAVARDRMAGWDVRRLGVGGPVGAPRLRFYVSDQSHYCHEQSMELLGLGRDAIRLVPSDEAYRMRLDSLAGMLAEDRDRGFRPIAVVATAGTVGTGAVDPIGAIVRLGRDEDIWVHVDGAYGAFAAIAPSAPSELAAMAGARLDRLRPAQVAIRADRRRRDPLPSCRSAGELVRLPCGVPPGRRRPRAGRPPRAFAREQPAVPRVEGMARPCRPTAGTVTRR